MTRRTRLACAVLAMMAAAPALAGARAVPASIAGPLRNEVLAGAAAPIMVTFRDHRAVDQATERFAARPGIRLRSVPVLAFSASADEIVSLGARSDVVRVELDESLPLLLPTATRASRAQAVWGAQDGGPMTVGGKVIDGSDIGVAIIDSGIDASHPDLRGRVVKNFRVVTDRLLGDVHEVMYGPDEPGAPQPNDQLVEVENSEIASGHGTHVAGIAVGDGTASDGVVRGTAPGARLYGFGAGASRSVVTSNSAAAMDWILLNHATVDPPIRVLNNSWGTVGEYDPDNTIVRLATKLVQAGVVITWGAGNGDAVENGGTCQDDRTLGYSKNPIPGVLSVANYDDLDRGSREGALDSSSSRGFSGDPSTWPDVSAPGSGITAALNLASEGLPIAALEWVETRGYSEDTNPMATPTSQHKGTVAFRLGAQTSEAATLDWVTWSAPIAMYEAHNDRFASAGAPDPRLFHPSGGSGPVARPQDAAQLVRAGDQLVLTKETGASNPIQLQVTSPSGTSKTFRVEFSCATGPCAVGLVSFTSGEDYQGTATVDLGSAFAGEPADGTWTITPGPVDATMKPFNQWYTESSGTSMAAPHVAGIVALMLDANPALTPAQVEDVIEETAHKFATGAPYVADPVNPGTTSSCSAGHGLVDARAAVERALSL